MIEIEGWIGSKLPSFEGPISAPTIQIFNSQPLMKIDSSNTQILVNERYKSEKYTNALKPLKKK